jgi:hypothetical protein
VRFRRQSRSAGIPACCIADIPVGRARGRRERRASSSARTIRADAVSKPAIQPTESLRYSASSIESSKTIGPDPNTNI